MIHSKLIIKLDLYVILNDNMIKLNPRVILGQLVIDHSVDHYSFMLFLYVICWSKNYTNVTLYTQAYYAISHTDLSPSMCTEEKDKDIISISIILDAFKFKVVSLM